MEKKTFIYGLKCPLTNEIRYVGKSNNPQSRFKGHIYATIKAFESNKRTTYKERWLFKLINKGLSPELIILDEILLSEYSKWEEYYIKLLKENGNKLVNFDDKGLGSIGARYKLVGRLQNNKNTIKGINKYDLNGNFIEHFKSLREAERITGIDHGNISKVCSGKSKHTHGFIFKYDNDNSEINIIINPNAMKKPVIKIDENGNILEEYPSIAEACKANSVDSGNVSRVCNGKTKSIKGMIFKFKNI